MTNILTKGTLRYIIIDAEGYYGDYATVYSSHATLKEARRKLGRRHDRRIVTDGGWNATHQPGNLIHRQFAPQYRI